MSRIEITTLNAELADGDAEVGYPEAADVVLRFGEAEVTRWSATLPYFRDPDDRLRFLEEFVAGKLQVLFEEKAA